MSPPSKSAYDTAITPPVIPFCSLTIYDAPGLSPTLINYLIDAIADRGEVEYRGGQYIASMVIDPIDRIVLPTLDPQAARVWLIFDPDPLEND